MGSKSYPEGTNHFSPSSPLFSDRQSMSNHTRAIRFADTQRQGRELSYPTLALWLWVLCFFSPDSAMDGTSSSWRTSFPTW